MEHEGHRGRLRERFMSGQSLDGFAPHETLELLLTYAIPRRDTNLIAHHLIDRFGSLHGVLEATVADLCQVDGVGAYAATLIAMILPVLRQYTLSQSEDKIDMRNRAQAERYCLSLLAGKRAEELHVICLDGHMRVINTVRVAQGTLNEVKIYPRLILSAVIGCNAAGAVLAHNHPGGSPKPSQEDVAVSQNIFLLLDGIGVTLFDHMIVAGDRAVSMRAEGYFSWSERDTEQAAEKNLRVLPARPPRAGKRKEPKSCEEAKENPSDGDA